MVLSVFGGADARWFDEARYGVFIHYGAYAVAARGEWVKNREKISKDEYTESYCRKFKAENLICAGRMVDCERGAYGALRVVVNCNQMGEAAARHVILMRQPYLCGW